MSIEEWFHTLTATLKMIEKEWPTASTNEKIKLAEQLLELRQISDQVVDLWLGFEEQLTGLLKKVRETEEQFGELNEQELSEQTVPIEAFAKKSAKLESSSSGKTGNPPKHVDDWFSHESDQPDHDLEDYAHMFRKGEGFYHLRLFADAKQCFANLLQESPDWEYGRLYYS
jgi:hypothetical protein